MLAQKLMGAKVATSGAQSLKSIIDDLGLTTNLKLCLDAGDIASYNPAVQTARWLDTSGNENHFFRGSSTTGDSNEPIFNGTAGGLSSNEYWSFDSSLRYFIYDGPVQPWMQNISRDNAKFSCFYIVDLPSTQEQTIFCTKNSSTVAAAGSRLSARSTDAQLFLNIANGTAGAFEVLSGVSGGFMGFHAVGLTLDEAATYSITLNESVKVNSSSAAYANPSTSGESVMTLCSANTGGSLRFASGAKFYCFAMWEGSTLTTSNLIAIYNGIKSRFGL